jgi:hypothetical protein
MASDDDIPAQPGADADAKGLAMPLRPRGPWPEPSVLNRALLREGGYSPEGKMDLCELDG